MSEYTKRKDPSAEYMTAYRKAHNPDVRPPMIELDGIQLIAHTVYGLETLKESRRVCFKRLRRDYERLGPNVKIEGFLCHSRRADTTQGGGYDFHMKLYLKKL